MQGRSNAFSRPDAGLAYQSAISRQGHREPYGPETRRGLTCSGPCPDTEPFCPESRCEGEQEPYWLDANDLASRRGLPNTSMMPTGTGHFSRFEGRTLFGSHAKP
jgi:hypothetical protein